MQWKHFKGLKIVNICLEYIDTINLQNLGIRFIKVIYGYE